MRVDGLWTFYVNGTGYTPENNTTTPNAIDDQDTFSVGTSTVNNENFEGSIDEVRFWTVARTAQQIKDTMYIKLQGGETGLLAYYNFDQEGITPGGDNRAMTTVADVAGGDNNLTISEGFALIGETSNFISSVKLGTFALGNNAYSVRTDGGSVTIPIVRTGGSEGFVTIRYQTTDDTARAGTDYTATDGSVTFAEGETNKEVRVTILPSSIDASKTFHFAISAQSGVGISTPGSATVTITPTPTVTLVQVNPAGVSIEKGGSQSFYATVLGAHDPAQTVTWSLEGGTSSETMINQSGELIIGRDETASFLTVKATSTVNTAKEGTATVTVHEPAPTRYAITQGQHGQWIKGGTGGLRFTANGEFAKFSNVVTVDGTAVPPEDYTAVSGSTIVTLNAAYLETLSVGRHMLRIQFADGYAETDFIITVAGGAGGDVGADVPQTGDRATPVLWLGMLLLAGAGLTVNAVRRRKRQNG